MRVAALSLAGVRLDGLSRYSEDLAGLLRGLNVQLAVLPAHTGLLLAWHTGILAEAANFSEVFRLFQKKVSDWHSIFTELHGALAKETGVYLLAGTVLESDQGRFYQTAYLFNPRGEICGSQRQTHLNREERQLGLSRGTELALFSIEGISAGIISGTDCRHPETGRILALQGADILLHPGAMEAGFNCWAQAAGVWAQVQQNQFWAVEAQLCAAIAGRSFAAESAVIGPCEATPALSGYLARGGAAAPAVSAALDQEARAKIKKSLPMLELLNPKAYAADLRR
ncbi:MAG: nitrilase-related carbon-nitrogen hydrolase [Bacillota bacterium]